MSSVHEFEFRIAYAYTDRMGVVYYANYFMLFERGRTELLRSVGWRYRDVEEKLKVYLPAMEASCPESSVRPSLYVFGGADGRGVGRNIFLDGNTFKDSQHVDKKLVVGEFKTGFAVQYKALRVTYSWITRSPEFQGQKSWERYGSVSLGLYFDF